MKIKINKLPKQLVKAQVGRQIQGSLAITPTKMGGGDYSNSLANKKTVMKQTLQPEKVEDSNLEAELGEVAYGGISGDNIPDTFKIGGKRHSEGGTPLNLPDGSFIYSDTASMKIKDPAVLKMFDLKPKKTGYTPAEIAKKYDINSYKKILYDPNSDEVSRRTATLMIKNYVIKLGYLALIQEATKGFPQGMPEAAEPVLETMGYSMEDFIPEPVMAGQQEIMAQEQSQNGAPMQMPNGAPIASEQSVYGDDADAQEMPVNPPMPMAQYGMTMGGYDMPMYPNGGVTVGGIPAQPATGGKLPSGGGYQPGTVAGGKTGATGVYRTTPGAERTYQQGAYQPRVANAQPYNAAGKKSLCDRLMQGATIANLVAENKGTTAGLTRLLADCIPQAEEKFKETQEAYYIDPTEEIIPTNDEEIITTEDEEIITTEDDKNIIPSVIPFQDKPMYSDVAARNIFTQATMNPNVPRTNFAVPYRAEMAGTYKDFLAGVQGNQRAEANTANLIAGTAGGSGEDFAKNMALSGQTAAANEATISNTQNANIQTGLGVNQFNAQTKNLNNAQRAEVFNTMFGTTAEAKLAENTGRNQIKQNKQMAIADAETELQNRALSNYQNKQYGTTYRRGLPYFKSGKPQVPQKSDDVNVAMKELQAIYGKDAKLGDLLQIYKMQQGQKQVKKGGQNNMGGYVLGDNIFPFMFY